MGNTLENKMKFFALYLGQKFETPNSTGNINWRIFEHWKDYSLISSVLLIRLSKISDEDAIEVAKKQVYRYNSGERTNMYEHHTVFMKERAEDYVRSLLINSIYWDEFSVSVYDILRSKGYALPYMGLSVKQLVEYGWVKLKD